MTADEVNNLLDQVLPHQRLRLVFSPSNAGRVALPHLQAMADPDRAIVLLDPRTSDAIRKAIAANDFSTTVLSFEVEVLARLLKPDTGRTWFVCRLAEGLEGIELI